MKASEALSVTVAWPPDTLTVSLTGDPTVLQLPSNVSAPPIVTAAPWSTREVDAGAVNRSPDLFPELRPVRVTLALERVPEPLKYAEL